MIEIKEHASPKYPPRTYQNAKTADLTVAFALDFETLGEKLTRKAAGEKYLPISINEDPVQAARLIYKWLREHDTKIPVINIAGNGIYSIAAKGWTQETINRHLYTVLSTVHLHWPIGRVISGGQTGVDLAGIVAAHAMGIDAVATLPKGFIQRGLDHKDVANTADQIREQVTIGAANIKAAEPDHRWVVEASLAGLPAPYPPRPH